MKLTLLSGEDVRRLVPMTEAIDAMASAFGQLSSGRATIPLRVSVEAERGVFEEGLAMDESVSIRVQRRAIERARMATH